jgi:alpha-tubulin suppressor-like RCC1 family protein
VFGDRRAVYTWGNNNHGQLGNGERVKKTSPTPVPSFTHEKISGVAAGAQYSMVWTESGKVYGWGDNASGQIGASSGSDIVLEEFSPVGLPRFPSPVINIACGWSHTLALTRDGSLYVWGSGDGGRLGLGDIGSRSSPVLSPLKNVSQIIAGASFSLFVTKTGCLMGCGSNPYGNLGLGDQESRRDPTVIIESDVTTACAGGNHTLAILKDGSLMSWGWNLFGQVAKPSFSSGLKTAFVVDKAEKPFKAMAIGAGWGFSWFINEDHELYCWGAASRGGHPEGYDDKKVPTKVDIKVKIARVSVEEEWQTFRWLFLGRLNEFSEFSMLPVEVLYHVVSVW